MSLTILNYSLVWRSLRPTPISGYLSFTMVMSCIVHSSNQCYHPGSPYNAKYLIVANTVIVQCSVNKIIETHNQTHYV